MHISYIIQTHKLVYIKCTYAYLHNCIYFIQNMYNLLCVNIYDMYIYI